MKTFLVTLALISSSFAQAVSLTHFTIYRDGGGQIEATVAESDEGLRINVAKCGFKPMPAGTEVEVRGNEFILQTKMILQGQAGIYSDQSPWLQTAETGTWTRMVYHLNVNQQDLAVEVHNPKISFDGKESNILAVLEKQARALCK